jgi:NitT/TauT family transport system ATP-binding protein
MQEALLEIWATTRKTMAFVTHDLEEAVFLADVVVVLASRPGRVHAVVRNPLPRPRVEAIRVSDDFASAKRDLWLQMQGARETGFIGEAGAPSPCR